MERIGSGLETELRLGLPGSRGGDVEKNEKKRVFSSFSDSESGEGEVRKNQVVGWPPVCAYRQKTLTVFGGKKMYVKVSMDGAPFLRKMELSMHKGYTDLVMSLEKLFGCFGIGDALKDADNCEFIPIYEDKDGDWMLLGDVPWGMFTDSCKRLRIMKKSDVKCSGLPAKDLSEKK